MKKKIYLLERRLARLEKYLEDAHCFTVLGRFHMTLGEIKGIKLALKFEHTND